jgi:hypothetical protein
MDDSLRCLYTPQQYLDAVAASDLLCLYFTATW